MAAAEPERGRPDGRLIAGVGASAGGAETLEHFFSALPAELGMAFVVLINGNLPRTVNLPAMLGRHTTMHVRLAVDGDVLQPDTVYLSPPDCVLTVEEKCLQLRQYGEQRERNPLDVLLASLARAQGDNAIGILLNSAPNDGALGLKSIKEEGGLTIAQVHDQAAARSESTPAKPFTNGIVDLLLPIERIGEHLRDYARSFRSLRGIVRDGESQREEQLALAIKEIYTILRKRVGHDFERYKERTFMRRVQRRMQVLQVSSLTDYAVRLREQPDEAGLLFRDLLIGVTSFFRDPESFEVISKQVIPRLFENVGVADTVRVWVPGCATGEEAYSLAILLREHMRTLSSVPKVQVFATDIDEAALAVARAGRYPVTLLEDVSQARLEQFFRPEPASYVLVKEVRDLCIFSAHSVIRDPPFSRMDFVSCRNLLIYFNSELQDDVIPVFHYALKPGGFLFLGPSESISRHTDLFSSIDKKHRIFQRRSALNTIARLPSWISKGRGMEQTELSNDTLVRKDQRLRQYVETRIMEAFAPSHILVEPDGNVVYYSARTGKYLEPQMGTPSRQILSMARRGLRLELRTALREAVEKRQLIVRERVEVELEDRVQAIRLSIEPLLQGEHETLFLVVFTDLGPPLTYEEAAQTRPAGQNNDVATLEHELKETRDRLQATIEEYETALEELKSGNEELVSVNEELQSTNEELETSKEELQSVNEELHTVNHELGSKVDELHRTNADLRNLFESTQIATVFLDRFMIIRSYTPAVTAVFNLIPSDRGRPITDIAHQLEDVDLRRDIRLVLDERKPLERSVRLRNGKVFHLMRILPYRTANDDVDGALVTFVNVTQVVVAEEQQRILVTELNHRVRNMLQVVIGLAGQTLYRSQRLQEFETAFMGRMHALGRAYELLSRDGWRNVPILELMQTQLSPFATEGKRYTAEGASLVLSANASLAFGLVLYELATNATKYGALSVASGHVHITWALHGNSDGEKALHLIWREEGGPAVEKPTRQGFGTELIERQLRYELNGDSTMDFAPEGLRVTIKVPASEAVHEDDMAITGISGSISEVRRAPG